MKTDLTEEELKVLAWTLLGEAGGEGRSGMEAVMHVIANRAESGRWSSNPAAVAVQKNSKGVHQFSTWNSPGMGGNDPVSRYSPGSSSFNTALSVIDSVLKGESVDPTRGATHFYATSMSKQPYWWDSEAPKGSVKIGKHIFGARRDEAPVAPQPATKPQQGYLDLKLRIEDAIDRWETPYVEPRPRLNRTIARVPPDTSIPLEMPYTFFRVNKRPVDNSNTSFVRPERPGALPAAKAQAAPQDIGIPPAQFPAAKVGDEVKISPDVPPRKVTSASEDNIRAQRAEQLSERNRKAGLIVVQKAATVQMPRDTVPDTIKQFMADEGIEAPDLKQFSDGNIGASGKLDAKPVTKYPFGDDPFEREGRLKPNNFVEPIKTGVGQLGQSARGKAGLGYDAPIPADLPSFRTQVAPEPRTRLNIQTSDPAPLLAGLIPKRVGNEPTWFEQITKPGLGQRIIGSINRQTFVRNEQRYLKQMQVAGNSMVVQRPGESPASVMFQTYSAPDPGNNRYMTSSGERVISNASQENIRNSSDGSVTGTSIWNAIKGV